MTKRPLAPAAAILGGWTVVALLFAPQSYLANRFSEKPLPAWVAIAAQSAIFGVWAALTPLVIRLARRFPLQRGTLRRAIALHLAASFVFCAAHLTLVSLIQTLLLPVPANYETPMPPALMLASLVATNVLLYWTLLAVATAVTYFRRDQQRELSLVQAQLQSLRSQLQPHFLFNTLNAIAELVHQDPRLAEKTVTQLSDVLRLTLQHDQAHEITLAEEVDLLRKHVAIYETLLRDRLRVRWAIDESALAARVPAMILQPLVENAIRHGIAPREGGGTVAVSARRNGSFLWLAVEDDGVGLGHGAKEGIARGGIGLSNTRARLRHLYGDASSFEMREPPGGGVAATVKVPLAATATATVASG